jgi:hypothetical protein
MNSQLDTQGINMTTATTTTRGRQVRQPTVEETNSVSSTDLRDSNYRAEGRLIHHSVPLQGPESIPNTAEQSLRQIIEEKYFVANTEDDAEFEMYNQGKMRSDLEQLDFHGDQTQASSHSKKQMPLPRTVFETRESSASKIKQELIDVQTLNYYDIPYQFDEDPNYIVILQDMRQMDIETLFDHTRRIRSKLRREYSSREHRSPHAINGRNKQSRPASIEVVKISKRQNTTRPVNKHLDTTLRVRPFLAWPTTFENREKQRDVTQSEGELSGVEEDEGLRIKLTLLAIYDRIYQEQTGCMTGSLSPGLVIYRSGPTNVIISTRSCPKKLFQQVELDPKSTLDTEVGIIPLVIRDELMHLLSQNKNDGQNPKTSIAANAGGYSLPFVPKTRTIHRCVLARQIARLHIERGDLVSTLRKLISQFVPELSDHELVQRCWGSIQTIDKVGDLTANFPT